MRTWGRTPITSETTSSSDGGDIVVSSSGLSSSERQWVEVSTDANGHNDAVWLTTLAQVLQLGLNESPIFGNWGIPGQQSVQTQIPPDYYVTLTQQNFSRYFLGGPFITKEAATDPTYTINVTANPGALLQNPVPV